MRIRLTLAAILAAFALVSLVKAAETGGVSGTVKTTGLPSIANIVVSLRAPGAAPAPAPKIVDLDQKAMQFFPRVLPILKGTTVRFLNSDTGPHNAKSPEGSYDFGIMLKGQSKEFKFDKPGIYTQLCAMHPQMMSFIVVLDTPYFGVTDETGRFDIKDVPSGKYTLVAWSERLKETTHPVIVESGRQVTADISLSR